MELLRITIAGYLCRPDAPTESGTPWWWAQAYANLGHQVTLLTSKTQEGFFNKKDLSGARSDGRITVQFVEHRFEKSKLIVAPNNLPQALIMSIQIFFWNRAAIQLANFEQTDFVHHVTLSTIRIFTPFSALKKLVVWGPLGGAHYGKLRGLALSSLPYEAVRNLSILVKGFRYSLRNFIKPFGGVLLATNGPTLTFARKSGFRDTHLEPSDGLLSRNMDFSKIGPPKECLMLLWAGRVVQSKRPDLAVRAVAQARGDGANVKLTILGDGVFRRSTEELILALGLEDHVTFADAIPWRAMSGMIDKHHAIVFTSARDSSSPLILEAAGRGRPSIAIRTPTVESLFRDSFVSGPSSYYSDRTIVSQLAKEFKSLIQDSSSYSQRQEAAFKHAQTQVWEIKAARIIDLVAKSHGPRASYDSTESLEEY